MRKTVLLLVLVAALSAIANAELISLHPSATTVPLGTPLSVDVMVSGFSDLYAWQFDIDFNPAILSATNVTEGALFSSIGVGFSPGFIDNVGGSVTFIGDSLSGPGPGVNTDGTLATITFDTIGVGLATIDLANVILLDSNLNDITATISGTSVTVTAASGVPEPSTFSLLLPVLAGIGFGIRRRLVR